MKISFELFDDIRRVDFQPLTFTRPVAYIRMGMFINIERWEKLLDTKFSVQTESYLMEIFGLPTVGAININARWIPSMASKEIVNSARPGTKLMCQGTLLLDYPSPDGHVEVIEIDRDDIVLLEKITDIFSLNDRVSRNDFELLNSSSGLTLLHPSVTLIGELDQLFIHPSATVIGATLNTSTGPIYIDQNAEIMEGALIRGPFYLGDHAGVKMGAKIYGATTIGPHSKVGGEISNSVIQGFSNKGHDGFLGNSILGEWCNLGADTNNSNLKNNYSPVKIWNYAANDYVDTGLTFCGLIMGDHSKSGINTMFNTGTVVGVCANIFGAGFPEKFIPSFSWGGADGFEPYQLNKAIETAQRMMARRNVPLTPEYIRMLEHLALKV
jgi:UDP-N-acetylglucosamine diphosphorylase/glucosamine-1-phosphate N-acetyltransferase